MARKTASAADRAEVSTGKSSARDRAEVAKAAVRKMIRNRRYAR